MTRQNKTLLILVAVLGGTLGLANCSSAPTAANNTNAAVVNAGNRGSNTFDAIKTAADPVGVAECDEYIQKYEACLNSKVPEAGRAALKTGFEQQRKAFKEAAKTPDGRAGLAESCRQALSTAKQATVAYGCAW